MIACHIKYHDCSVSFNALSISGKSYEKFQYYTTKYVLLQKLICILKLLLTPPIAVLSTHLKSNSVFQIPSSVHDICT